MWRLRVIQTPYLTSAFVLPSLSTRTTFGEVSDNLLRLRYSLLF